MNNHHVGNNIDHYGDGYMEQEEEWEREGLLDPAWEKQQKKVGASIIKSCKSTRTRIQFLEWYTGNDPSTSSLPSNAILHFGLCSQFITIMGL